MASHRLESAASELELFLELGAAAFKREHSLISQLPGVARWLRPGDWIGLAELARGMEKLSDGFLEEMLWTCPELEQRFTPCRVCGNFWCEDLNDPRIGELWAQFESPAYLNLGGSGSNLGGFNN